MGNLKAVITDHVFENFEQERAILQAAGIDLTILQCKSIDELLPQISDAEGLLNTYLSGIDATVFDAAPNLKAVVRYGIGVDTIDIPAATEHGIKVANVPDYCINEVADHALAHFLCLARKISFADHRVKAGEWSLGYCKPMPAIRKMRVGIIGFGRIGRAIASRLAPFGCEIVFADPFVDQPVGECSPVQLDTMFESSHAIFVQCPGSGETHHLLNADAFTAMQQKPLIINCARGEVIDTDALVEALQSGRVSGAGLDLLEDHETVIGTDHPLRSMDNVNLTPHSAWFSDTAIPSLQARAAETLAEALTTDGPASLLNPEVRNT